MKNNTANIKRECIEAKGNSRIYLVGDIKLNNKMYELWNDEEYGVLLLDNDVSLINLLKEEQYTKLVDSLQDSLNTGESITVTL